MKYKERDELVRGLRDLADFYDKPSSIIFPNPYVHLSHTIYEGEWNKDYSEYQHNEKAEHDKLSRYVRALGACEKKWNDNNLTVKKVFGKRVSLAFSVDRKVVCKKVVKSTKQVPKKVWVEIPNEYDTVDDEVEWVCEDLSLLS
jgi:hypothetical protein